MAIHVGIDPYDRKFSYYTEPEKKRVNIKISNTVYTVDIEKVDLMYNKITSKINGELGYACIADAYPHYNNEIRKKFIESGLKYGFKSVEIINWETNVYLYAMSQMKYKLMNGNVIWIYWDINIYIWEINKQKAKYIGEWYIDRYKEDLQQIINESKLNREPNIVLSRYKNDKETFKKLANCQFFVFNMDQYYISKAALLKARITAGDLDFAHLLTVNQLSQKITLKIANKKIKCFNQGKQLPIFYNETLTKTSDINFLEIVPQFWKSETFSLPNKSKFNLSFKIDSNEIFSVRFSDNLKEDNSPSSNVAVSSLFYTIPKNNVTKNDQTCGIDLGTSRCCVAVSRKNGINTVPLDNNGERLLPSFISYDEKNVKCGKVVVNRLRHFSKSTIFDSKRIIGRSFNDIEIDENWNFAVNFENEKVYLEIIGINGRMKITAEEVAADLLKYMKQKTEEFQGQKLIKAVITVPAAFTEVQKSATLEAANLAGWKEIKLLPEPIAAAFAYFVDRPIPNNSTVLLFDLGGGTLDVCIFKVENDQIQILCNTGDSKLGGRNFDTVLINYFKNILNTKHGISALKDKKYKLKLECQRIKEDLSTGLDSSLDIDEFDTTKQGIISINREEFQRMTQSLLNKIQNTIQSALFKSKLESNQINKVLHVGGGSRMPMIKELLQNIFSEAEHCIEEHPDEVVAIGAAYYACNIFSE